MTNNDQAAALETVSAKSGWVKPEIVSFVPASAAQGANPGADVDGTPANTS